MMTVELELGFNDDGSKCNFSICWILNVNGTEQGRAK